MRRANVTDAMDTYTQILPNVWNYSKERIRDSTDLSSWNWAAVYLREYFYMRQTWFAWRDFTHGLFDSEAWAQIPLSGQSQLISTLGWASIRKTRLRDVISEQHGFLADTRWNDHDPQLAFLKALHYITLGYAYTLAFERLKALHYAQLATQQIDPEAEPFYAIRAQEILGTLFYTFGQYDQALACYANIRLIIQNVGLSASPLLPHYGEGWAYIGNQKLYNALETFRQGSLHKSGSSLYYDFARCKYGEGYTLFLLGHYDDALQSLYEALTVFCDDHFDLNERNHENSIVSPAMAAACSHVLALTHERRGDIQEALKYEVRAMNWQRAIDDPGQLSDMLRRAVKLNLKAFHLLGATKYLFEFAQLRLSYRVPTLCLA